MKGVLLLCGLTLGLSGFFAIGHQLVVGTDVEDVD